MGNYVGAIRPALKLAEEYDSYYFIADYHALTVVRDPEELTRLTFEVTASWLAMGLDPERTVIYRQSDVPEVFELFWLLNCVTSKGLMNRAHAYKAAVAEAAAAGKADADAGVNMGLYSYPVLMAADILLFSADVVPVGKDQSQHVEYARDIAQRFNQTFGQTLRVPEPMVSETAATILGSDGQKMSKSYGNTIPLFAHSGTLQKLIRRTKTDSTAADAPKDPETSGLFQIYREIATPEQTREVREELESGAMSWGRLKEIVFETVDAFMAKPRERYQELMADTTQILDILAAGAGKARPEAVDLVARVRRAVGRPELPV